MGWPIISAAVYPSSWPAEVFQEVIVPSSAEMHFAVVSPQSPWRRPPRRSSEARPAHVDLPESASPATLAPDIRLKTDKTCIATNTDAMPKGLSPLRRDVTIAAVVTCPR